MTLTLPDDVTTWEAVAAVILAQSVGAVIAPMQASKEITEIVYPVVEQKPERTYQQLLFGEAHRAVDKSDKWYGEGLARTNNLPVKLHRLKMPFDATTDGGIIVCPFPISKEMEIPLSVWRVVVRLLRTYGVPVRVMGDRGQRIEGGMPFTEAEILSDLPVSVKLEALASARVIVGIPNAWSWLASAWDKHMLMVYPESLPILRWYPYSHEQILWLQVEKHRISIPVMLTGVRKLMARL